MKLLLTILFVISFTANAASCDQELADLLITKNEIFANFMQNNPQLIKELQDKGLLLAESIDPEELIYAREVGSGLETYIFNTRQGLISVNKKGSHFLNSDQSIGYNLPEGVESRFEIIHSKYLLKTVNGQVVLLPAKDFSEGAVEALIKEEFSNKEYVLKWMDELKKLAVNPVRNDTGTLVGVSIESMKKGEFIDVSVEGSPNQKLTLLVLGDTTFFLSKEHYPWMKGKDSFGMLDYSDVGFLSQGKSLGFLSDDGRRFVLNRYGLFDDHHLIVEALAKQIEKEAPGLEADFFKSYKKEIVDLIADYGFEIEELDKIQVFSVSGKANDYIAVINNTPFYFSKDGIPLLNTQSTWALLEPQKMGFGSRYHEEIVVNDTHILKFQNDGTLTLSPINEKDPSFLKEIINSDTVDQGIKQVVTEFESEFIELLKRTNLTKQDFNNADMKAAMDKKTGKMIILFSAGDEHVLLTQEKIHGDNLFQNSRMYILGEKSSIGFHKFEERVLDIPGHMQIKIGNEGIEIIAEDREVFAEGVLKAFLTPEQNLPSFVTEMILLNKDSLKSLLKEGKIRPEDILPPNSSFGTTSLSQKNFWVIKSDEGSFLFEVNANIGIHPTKFQSLDHQEHGERLFLATGEVVRLKRTIGFNSQLVEGGDIVDDHEFALVVASKAQYLLNRKMGPAEVDKLLHAKEVDAYHIHREEYNTQDELIEKLIGLKKKILVDEGHFTEEESITLIENLIF